MHRQGFFAAEVPRVIRLLRRGGKEIAAKLCGVYTHFASAKDVNYPTYTEVQFEKFLRAVRELRQEGYLKNAVLHAAATGATLLKKKYHLGAVRIGIGLYGIYPSRELELQMGDQIGLRPVLRWKALISEVKNLPRGAFVGYDLVERVAAPTRAAVIPIGYWHGLPRLLSSRGTVLVRGKRARILGRVSMDLIVVDVSGIPCKQGDEVVLIGKSGNATQEATLLAAQADTIPYEILTRINPLIKRVLVP
ncbi:alanine racemase, partial [Candidatus Parcubacteria bacterium]